MPPLPDVADPIAVYGRGLRPYYRIPGVASSSPTLEGRMRELHVPGVSFSVINRFAIEAGSLGCADKRTDTAVAARTQFNANSVSKSAAAVLFAVLHAARKIDLDKSVNAYLEELGADFRLRMGAKISPSDFAFASEAEARAIYRALADRRMLNSDGYLTAEFVPHESFHLGDDLSQFDKSTLGVLTSKRMATHPPCDRTIRQILCHRAGISVSGLPGYLPEDAPTLADLLSPNADAWIARKSKTKIGMIEVVFDPTDDVVRGTTSYAYSGGGYVIAADHAKLICEIQRAARGDTTTLLSRDSAIEILTGVPPDAERGLGVMVEADGGISHSGSNEGYRSYFRLDKAGNGIVFLTNGDNGFTLGMELLRSASDTLGWAAPAPPLELADRPAEVLQQCVGVFSAPDKPEFHVSLEEKALKLEVKQGEEVHGTWNLVSIKNPIEGDSRAAFVCHSAEPSVAFMALFTLDEPTRLDIQGEIALTLHRAAPP